MVLTFLVTPLLLSSCKRADDGNEDPPIERIELTPARAWTSPGVRRLTQAEVDAALDHAFGDGESLGSVFWPTDFRSPFDNDVDNQVASRVLVEGVERAARDLSTRYLAGELDWLVDCDRAERACQRSFVADLGRRAWRRPLSAGEVDGLLGLMDDVASQDDLDAGYAAVIEAFVQDPAFLYRFEVGTPVSGQAGVFRLGDLEIASRMAWLVWGAPPDEALIDEAVAAGFTDADRRVATLDRMMDDDRFVVQLTRFHAMWIGYDTPRRDLDLGYWARFEADAIVADTLATPSDPWTRILTRRDTWVNGPLAEHYGLSGGTDLGEESFAWVEAADVERGGLLGTMSFLSEAGNVLDTSPTKRGKLVQERLMCRPVPPPPPDVMADAPPAEDGETCKFDRYEQHRSDPGCASCHQLMDDIGFGLENYDVSGAFRDFDYFPESSEENPACPVDGSGSVLGEGAFSGPRALAELLVERELVQGCFVEHLLEYASGTDLDDNGTAVARELGLRFLEGGADLRELFRELVRSESFVHRREEVIP